MTSLSTRLIVFSLVINFLVCDASSSFSGKFLLEIFGNPIKDLENTFLKPKEEPRTSSVREEISHEGGDNPQTKMIDVPLNTERCRAGLVMDINGVCRQPCCDVVSSMHYNKMDAKCVLFVMVMVVAMCAGAQPQVVFNFHEKLRLATTTPAGDVTQQSQIIRVPELECPLGQRRDKLGNCRQRL
ncbi:hypothetical protein B5X24_HaOG211570 [Helicoverpa armigera]|nr:hypothetical protein B5X24_HaOG211570 [Helicoverpa armigera]